MIVVIETVLAVVGHVDVGPAIIVVIADSHTKAPSFIGHAGLCSYIRESTVVVVVEQHCARGGFFPL